LTCFVFGVVGLAKGPAKLGSLARSTTSDPLALDLESQTANRLVPAPFAVHPNLDKGTKKARCL
jgi:hypothetical protein